MADDKNGRDKQAQNAERRQREREIDAELERGDELEPPVEAEALADLEAELDALSFPATGAEVVAAIGDRTVESATGRYSIAELVPETEAAFDSPAAVRVQVQRPAVAAAMKQVVEASGMLRDTEFSWSQRKAYENTFEELEAVDTVDDDEGIHATTDWIVQQITEKKRLPSSRAVRREAAKFCRANGYQIRNDEWLGI